MSDDQNYEAFERLFLPMQTVLRGYLFAATRDWTATDELFMEVATVLWAKFGDFDPKLSFRAWSIGIARLQVLKRRQSLARSRLVFSEEAIESLAAVAGAEPEVEDVRLAHLAECMGKLPPNERELVTRRFEQNQSMAQIAGGLKRSVEAVAMLMMRIRRRLRDCVEKAMAMEKVGIQ